MNLNSAIDDSWVEKIAKSDGSLTVAFSAYIHKSKGKPGIDSGTGWSQDAELSFEEAEVIGDLPNFRVLFGADALNHMIVFQGDLS
jgi:hypothetical protein